MYKLQNVYAGLCVEQDVISTTSGENMLNKMAYAG